MIRVSANYHWAKMTSSVFMLLFDISRKQTTCIDLLLIIVKYIIFHNMS